MVWFSFLIFILLRLPSLFEPFTYGDEGIYLALGQALRKGLVFYRDIHDNKPPLLYLIAALAGNFKTYRFIYFLWSIPGFFLFCRLAQNLFPKNRKAIQVSLFSFSVLAAIPLFEGTIANAENFSIYASIAAFLILTLKNQSKLNFFFAGILFSLSTLFKVPAGLDFAAAVVFLLFYQKKRAKAEFISLLIGFLTPITLSFAYYFAKDAGLQYFTAAFAQNIPYLSSWGTQKTQAFSLPIPLIIRGFIFVILPIAILFFLRKKKLFSSSVNLILVWFSLSIFGALLSSRPYPHYLFQAVPAICLSLGFLFSAKKSLRLIPVVFAGVIFYIFSHFNYFHYQTLPYYQNFYLRVLGRKSQEEYISFWGNHVSSLYKAATYLKARTTANEKIFIWGDHPELYPLTERLPVGRYAAAYHIKGFDQGYQKTLSALEKSPPRFFIVFKNEKKSLNELFYFLEENYSPLKTFDEIKIYRLL